MSVPETGTWKIISLVGENVFPTAGVDDTKPAFQPVRLNEPVQDWYLTQQAGYFVFRFAVKDKYPYTGVEKYTTEVKSLVIATIDETKDEKWNLIYREDQKAYTISPGSDLEKGWTVSPEFSVNPEIWISPIVSTKSIPPKFLPTQLFRFEKLGE